MTARYLTDEVVEKAARAEWESEWPDRPWEKTPDDLRDFYRSVARTSLSAVLPDIIRQAKAEAWDEGAAKGAEVGMDAIDLNPMHANPYRADQIEQGGQL